MHAFTTDQDRRVYSSPSIDILCVRGQLHLNVHVDIVTGLQLPNNKKILMTTMKV